MPEDLPDHRRVLDARQHPAATVKIAPAKGEHAILAALQSTVGTSFVIEEVAHG